MKKHLNLIVTGLLLGTGNAMAGGLDTVLFSTTAIPQAGPQFSGAISVSYLASQMYSEDDDQVWFDYDETT